MVFLIVAEESAPYMDRLQHSFSTWKMVKPSGFSVGLETKAPLTQEIVLKGLRKLGEAFPELTETDFRDKEEVFSLKKDSPPDERVAIRIQKFRKFFLNWGINANLDFKEATNIFFEVLQSHFEISSVNLKIIDLAFMVKINWKGNHYRAILQTFCGNGPLFSLSDPRDIVENTFFLRGIVDEHRLFMVSAVSNVADCEVYTGKYSKDTLRIYGAVGQLRNLSAEKHIAQLFTAHAPIALNFIEKHFIPSIVMPLDAVLSELAAEKQEKRVENFKCPQDCKHS